MNYYYLQILDRLSIYYHFCLASSSSADILADLPTLWNGK